MRRHAGQARQTGPPRQGEQQGFHLVIGVLGQRHIAHIWPLTLHSLGQGQVAGLSGSILGALARRMPGLHAAHAQGHIPLLTDLLAVALEVVGCRLQSMVNVHRPHLPRPALGTGQQQSGRVGTTTEGHHKRKARAEISQGLFEGQRHGCESLGAGPRL